MATVVVKRPDYNTLYADCYYPIGPLAPMRKADRCCGQNVGLDDLVGHDVEPEGDALDSLELMFSNIETHIEGDFAWAIADTEVKAVVKRDKREIHNRGHETPSFFGA